MPGTGKKRSTKKKKSSTKKKVTAKRAELSFTITEYRVESTAKTKKLKLNIDGQTVAIPVPPDVHAYFNDQFSRPSPTPLQQKRYTTLMNIARAAYLKGIEDGKSQGQL